MNAAHLYKRFGDKVVLEDVSLTVPDGAVVCLMAPSGRGKTTLLRCIAGLEMPDSGTVTGVPERLGFVFQEDRLCPQLDAVENVRLVTGRAMDEGEICRHLKELGLADSLGQPVRELSGGMRRRVSIGRAVCFGAGLLLLDEPAAGMNPNETGELMETIQFVREHFGMTILLIEHDMKLVSGICEELTVLNFGQVLAQGKTADVLNNPEVTSTVLNDPKVITAYLGE